MVNERQRVVTRAWGQDVGLVAAWDEALHPRDKGKFATKQGKKGEEHQPKPKMKPKPKPPKLSKAQREQRMVKAILAALADILPHLSTAQNKALVENIKNLAEAFIEGQANAPHHGGGGGSKKGSRKSSPSSATKDKSTGSDSTAAKSNDKSAASKKPDPNALPAGVAGIVEGIEKLLNRTKTNKTIPPASRDRARRAAQGLSKLQSGSLVASWTEDLHPRDLHGRFIDVSITHSDNWLQITDKSDLTHTWIPRGSEHVVQDFLHGRLPTDRVKSTKAGVRLTGDEGRSIWINKGQIDNLKALDRDGHLNAQAYSSGLEAGDKSAKSIELTPASSEDRVAFKEKFGKPIPPAWKNVVVDFNDGAELIARGEDASGKAQYIYTDSFHERKAAEKHDRLNQIFPKVGEIEDGLRTVDDDPTRAVARLMLLEGIRVGSTSEQRGKVPAFGASTLRASHAKMQRDGSLKLNFVAKEGIPVEYTITDPEIVGFVKKRLAEKPGPDEALFKTNSNKSMKLLREVSGLPGMKNHDLRTLLANRIAVAELSKRVPPTPQTKKQADAVKKEVAEIVSAQLRNKPVQALSSYINPAVFSPIYES